MDKKSKGVLTPDRKLWIYSAHDNTVANLMNTLNIFEAHFPPYAATLLVELRINANNEHVVTVSKILMNKDRTIFNLMFYKLFFVICRFFIKIQLKNQFY